MDEPAAFATYHLRSSRIFRLLPLRCQYGLIDSLNRHLPVALEQNLTAQGAKEQLREDVLRDIQTKMPSWVIMMIVQFIIKFIVEKLIDEYGP